MDDVDQRPDDQPFEETEAQPNPDAHATEDQTGPDAEQQQNGSDAASGPEADQQQQQSNARPKSRYININDSTLQTNVNYYIKGVIPHGSLIVVWGPPGSGKSFIVFDIVMHIALGREYRGRKVKKGTAVYIACEGGGGFFNRMVAFKKYCNFDPRQRTPFFLLPETINLVENANHLISEFQSELEGESPSVVVIDTLSRSLTGSETKDEDMAKYIAAADQIRKEFDGCTVIIVHHCGISGDRPRGHTSLTGAADTQIAIAKANDGVITAKIEKMRDEEDGLEFYSQLKRVELGTDDDGDIITSCVVEVVEDEGPRMRPKQKAFNQNQQELFSSLQTVIGKEGKFPIDASGNIPADVKCVEVETWRKYYYARSTHQLQDTKKRVFQRRAELLKGYFGKWEDWVWLTPPVVIDLDTEIPGDL